MVEEDFIYQWDGFLVAHSLGILFRDESRRRPVLRTATKEEKARLLEHLREEPPDRAPEGLIERLKMETG